MLARVVVDSYVAAFGGELFGQQRSQASKTLSEWKDFWFIDATASRSGVRTDLEAPVIRTFRPFRSYGIVTGTIFNLFPQNQDTRDQWSEIQVHCPKASQDAAGI